MTPFRWGDAMRRNEWARHLYFLLSQHRAQVAARGEHDGWARAHGVPTGRSNSARNWSAIWQHGGVVNRRERQRSFFYRRGGPHLPKTLTPPDISRQRPFLADGTASCGYVPAVFSWGMTRGDVLQYVIAFALTRASKVVRGLRQGLSESERYAVAEHVVGQLKDRGDPWHLNDEAKATPGHTT